MVNKITKVSSSNLNLYKQSIIKNEKNNTDLYNAKQNKLNRQLTSRNNKNNNTDKIINITIPISSKHLAHKTYKAKPVLNKADYNNDNNMSLITNTPVIYKNQISGGIKYKYPQLEPPLIEGVITTSAQIIDKISPPIKQFGRYTPKPDKLTVKSLRQYTKNTGDNIIDTPKMDKSPRQYTKNTADNIIDNPKPDKLPVKSLRQYTKNTADNIIDNPKPDKLPVKSRRQYPKIKPKKTISKQSLIGNIIDKTLLPPSNKTENSIRAPVSTPKTSLNYIQDTMFLPKTPPAIIQASILSIKTTDNSIEPNLSSAKSHSVIQKTSDNIIDKQIKTILHVLVANKIVNKDTRAPTQLLYIIYKSFVNTNILIMT